MAPGDTDVSIVESPITATKVATALDDAITATSAAARVTVTGFNQGRSILITAIEV